MLRCLRFNWSPEILTVIIANQKIGKCISFASAHNGRWAHGTSKTGEYSCTSNDGRGCGVDGAGDCEWQRIKDQAGQIIDFAQTEWSLISFRSAFLETFYRRSF
jgi:hypothetical protein